MDWTKFSGPRDYMKMKRLIDAYFEAMVWETDPQWEEDMKELNKMIKHFWIKILERE